MRMYLRKRKKHNFNKLLFFFFFAILIIVSYFCSKNINNYFISVAEKEVYKMTKDIISSSKIDEDFDIDKIYSIIEDNNKNSIINYNSNLLNNYSNAISKSIKDKYNKFENNNIVLKIPFGSIFKNPMISNMGPMIPVKIKLIGNVNSDIKIDIKEYGINSSVVIVKNVVVINERIILPMIYKDIKVKSDFPISYKIINGSIPDYYSN